MALVRVDRNIRRYDDASGGKIYHVDITMYGRRKRGRARTMEEARKLKAHLTDALANSIHYPERFSAERIHLSEFVKYYQKHHLSVRAPGSLRQDVDRLNVIKKRLGNPYIDAITTKTLQRFLTDGRRAGWSPATYNRYRTRLNNLFRKAVEWDYLEVNPAAKLECLRETKMGDRYLSDQELSRLLDACDDASRCEGGARPNVKASLRPLVELAVYTGMRQGELMWLRWEDVEPDLAFLSLRGDQTKTGEPRRIPLVEDARRVLVELGPEPTGRLFPWKQFPRKQWATAIRALGWDKTDVARLRGWRFHDLRHHAASRMVMSGMSLYKVGAVLGHKNIETTARYAHLSPDSLSADMERAFRPISEMLRKPHLSEVGEAR